MGWGYASFLGLFAGIFAGIFYGMSGIFLVIIGWILFTSFGGKFYGIAGTLGITLGEVLGCIYLILRGINIKLTKNIYIEWGNIDTSFFAEKRLIRQIQESPVLGLQFVKFLFMHRPKNQNLAGLLAQVATATQWKQARLSLEPTVWAFSGYEIEYFREPDSWQAQIKVVRQSLITAHKENQISIKKDLFAVFVQELDKMHKLTLTPFPYPKDFWGRLSVSRNIDWYKYYREAIEAWQEVAHQKLEEIKEQASLAESMARNFYRPADTLTVLDESVFMERRDLRDKLSRQLHTTKGFLVLYLQGQRRVGKTSLINFFPQILGIGFEIIYFNAEGNIKSVPDFLQKLHEAFVTKTQPKETTWQQPAHWADALREFIGRVGDYAKQKGKRVILAIDEFEYLHPFLQADEAQGKEFLGAFRAMLGSQADVSLMWIGLHFFSELTAPNWNEFFVNTIRIEVPYLTREESYQLIEVAQLAYPDAVKEEIYRLTQGQPALIQKICFAIVDIANRDGRRAMTEADLQEALKRMIYIQDNNVTDVFWTQICEKDEQGRELDKAIVWAVREGKPIPRTVRHRLRRLEEYGFVVQAGEGYKIRVPIFEYWIDNFTQYFDLSKMEV
ncbi:MAG: ATP-binding protein [Bacteroidetes bacterium]|nr:MAG: ATP-binding protein [Bacteroidota bacterium]